MINITRTFFARKNIENRFKKCSKIPEMENLCTAANFVKNAYIQSNGNEGIT